MINNKKGFIAISLIYSFFLLFLMAMMSVIADYAQNRLLLNDAKKVIKEKLNGLSEFNPISLDNRTYQAGETISYANDSWIVVNDNGDDVEIILTRALSNIEITNALSKYSSLDKTKIISGDEVTMCYSGYTSDFCCYDGSDVLSYNLYYWDDSIPNKILDNWLNDNALLQKAIALNTLVKMEFRDGTKKLDDTPITYNEYIKIPSSGEVDDSNIWNLTYYGASTGQSIITSSGTNYIAHSTYKQIRPIITVKKKSL
jgi:hypothetical protein